MRKLEKGRDDYPARAVWNSLPAAVVFQRESIESLRRELSRNGDLLNARGFDTIKGKDAAPTSSAYAGFLKKVLKCPGEVDRVFESLVKELTEELPGFGERPGADGKAIPSHAKGEPKDRAKDGRGDLYNAPHTSETL